MINSSHRPLPDNNQHSQDTDIHAPGGIRTRNPFKRMGAEPRLGQRGHWDRLCIFLSTVIPTQEL